MPNTTISPYLSFAAIAERERALGQEKAPRALYIIRAQQCDGTYRYYNLRQFACNAGAIHYIPEYSAAHYHAFYSEADARVKLEALKEIDRLGGTKLFTNGRILKRSDYPQYN